MLDVSVECRTVSADRSRGALLKGPEATGVGEKPAWASVGEGWRPLHGNSKDAGYSVEWHDFQNEQSLDWSRSFHPGALEICLNVEGRGEIRAGNRTLTLEPGTAGFYFQENSRLKASRSANQHHQFLTVELSLPFLTAHFLADRPGLHPQVSESLSRAGRKSVFVSEASRLTVDQQHLIGALRHPPVFPSAHRVWYLAKALEVASTLLYRPTSEEFFCERIKRVNRERAQKVIAILREDLSYPPSLREIGQRVGCSQYHLSRIFTQETGKTISACLRELRMEKAARLLLAGEMKISQIALEVGYSSPSHFTTTFRETFDCCPGLYAVQTSRATAQIIGQQRTAPD